MTDLADFLLARIGEDEEVARAATGEQWRPGAFVQDGRRLWSVSADPRPLVARIELEPDTVHIARWDPARVLAECEAKRRIVEAEPERWILQPDAPGHTVDMATPEGMVRVYGKLITELEYRDRYMELAPPSQTLLYLALPYADHPDFREEWRA